MTAIFLSLLAAGLYGVGDFWGALASRRTNILRILPTILLTGSVTIFALIPFLGASFTPDAIRAGCVAGAFGTAGFVLVYSALAIGPMGVASAIIAVLAAGIPYAIDLLRGTQLSTMGVVGSILAFVSILLVCRSTEEATHPVTRKLIVMSIIAGFAVAGFFLGLAMAPKDTGLAPITVTRLIQLTMVVIFGIARRKTFNGDKPDHKMGIGSGIADALAAAAFIFATHSGSLAVVAIVTNLYPAVTLLFAHFVIHEKLERHQILGMIGACASVGLLTLA